MVSPDDRRRFSPKLATSPGSYAPEMEQVTKKVKADRVPSSPPHLEGAGQPRYWGAGPPIAKTAATLRRLRRKSTPDPL